MVVNEALLAGSKVVCSKIAGAAILINEENGVMFNPKNVEELSEKLNIFLMNLNQTLENIKKIRQNNMPFRFDEKVNILLSKI